VTSQLIFCRAGFEAEAAAELADRAAQHGIAGYPEAQRGSGFAWFRSMNEGADPPKITNIAFADLIFARQRIAVSAELEALDPKDRLTPILAALPAPSTNAGVFGDVFVEHPDSDEHKPLAALARGFGNALRPALRKAGKLTPAPDATLPRLHVVFFAGDHVALGVTDPRHSSPWPQGIPRLKLHHDAPSRSALKLEEALSTLLTDEERARWLKPGMKAADLGAAPGGWSWVLARQGIHVTAIDNGPLADTAHATGLIRHLRADGFSWLPQQPLDWMVCDMVEQPKRVAARMAQWFAGGWCRRAIFNLKLPMKKRYPEVQANMADFERLCAQAGIDVQWRARQLYHDREEITVFAFTA
jgi:23S rRNA (cytidine2498-2'-O)-methyltransferase